MELNKHDLSQLFQQMGYSGEAGDIDTFVASHRLQEGMGLAQAPFWGPAQATFLTSALTEDSDWSAAVDELSVRLASGPDRPA
jgi:Protein of unknown function (DUF2789)